MWSDSGRISVRLPQRLEGLAVKICLQCRDAGDVGSIPRLASSPGGGNGSPLQYSHQEDIPVHEVTKSRVTDRQSIWALRIDFGDGANVVCPLHWMCEGER